MPSVVTRLSFASFTALVSLACSSEPTASEVRTPLMPLTAGAQWHYVVRDSVEIGEVRGDPLDRFVMRVSRDTTIGRERWARVENASQLFEDTYDEAMYLRNRADGMYEWNPPSDIFPIPIGFDPVFRLYKYPAQKGELSTLYPPSHVTATDAAITVPAGTFSTVRYDDASGNMTVFIAPGVGVVKKVSGLTILTGPAGEVLGRWRLVYQLEAYSVP